MNTSYYNSTELIQNAKGNTNANAVEDTHLKVIVNTHIIAICTTLAPDVASRVHTICVFLVPLIIQEGLKHTKPQLELAHRMVGGEGE